MNYLDIKRKVERSQRAGKEKIVLTFKSESEYARNGIEEVEVKVSDVANVHERDMVIYFDSLGFKLNDIVRIR